MSNTFPPPFNEDKDSSQETLFNQSSGLTTITQRQIQQQFDRDKHQSKQRRAGLPTLAKILAISIIPLTVLATGITTYYYANNSFEQIDDNQPTNLKQPRRLLPMLLLSTGATLSGALAAFWANRIMRSARSSSQTEEKEKITIESTKRTNLRTRSTEQIATPLNSEDILQTAVQEARKAIAADRVVVYSLNEQFQGNAIAESVDPRYPQALGTAIDRSYFDDYDLDYYQSGRVTAINDIERANLTDSYLSQMEPLAVKANLIAPILNQGKLIGILVAHHCAAPHIWKSSEIEALMEIANQISLVLDNIKLLTTSALLRQQKETETERINLLTNATKKILASGNEVAIFSTAVHEARKAIAADRVIVYSLDEQSKGKVIAESVDSRYPQALEATIDDPCFNTYYLEKYQNGRVKATNDIYQANLTDCHLSQLEPFAVKANLVVPILNQGKLIGLLVAHHCAAPHIWQPSEIEVLVQIATQIDLALNSIKLLTTSAHLQEQQDTETKLIHSLTQANEKIRASLAREDIFETTVKEARKAIAADRVLVYSLDEQSQGKVIAESVASDYPQSLGVTIDDPCFSTFYLEKYQNGRVKATDDIYQANLTNCHIAQLEPLAVKANLVVPIIIHSKIIGLLIAHHCAAPHAWQQSEIDVMVEIAQQVGLTLDNSNLLREIAQISQAFLEQLPAVADFAQVAISSAQQAQIQVQQTSQTIKTGREVANQTISDLSDVQDNIIQTVGKIQYLSKSAQKISQLVTLIDHLATQINLQGMNMLIKASKTEEVSQTPLASPIAQAMESLREELAEATTELQSFVGKIETEVNDLGITMKAKIEKIVRGADLVEETWQKLNQIDTVTASMSALLSNIIHAAAKGVHISTSNSQAILGNTNLVPQNVEQSSTMAESLNKLTEVYEQVEASLVLQEHNHQTDRDSDS